MDGKIAGWVGIAWACGRGACLLLHFFGWLQIEPGTLSNILLFGWNGALLGEEWTEDWTFEQDRFLLFVLGKELGENNRILTARWSYISLGSSSFITSLQRVLEQSDF